MRARLSRMCIFVIMMTSPSLATAPEGLHVEEGLLSIPPDVLRMANEYVISKVGEERFTKYFTLNPEKVAYIVPDTTMSLPIDGSFVPHYCVDYEFHVPGLASVTVPVSLCLDTRGRVMGPVSGLPDCVSDSTECVFDINEAKAIAIAREHGLEPGLRGYEAHFFWSGKHGYVWGVKNYLRGKEGRSGGDSMLIDANSGEVLEDGAWKIFN